MTVLVITSQSLQGPVCHRDSLAEYGRSRTVMITALPQYCIHVMPPAGVELITVITANFILKGQSDEIF